MKLIEVKNHKELSRIASEIIIESVKRKPNSVIGFATGKTPKRTYKNLVKAYKNKRVDFSRIKAFNLDEFYPISKNSCKSYKRYLSKRIFSKINISPKNIFIIDGATKSPKRECESYEKKLAKNRIDLQILGMGKNGHIGFNEPGSPKNSKTRVVELTHIKGKAITMGIKSIMNSKNILLLVSGKKKSKAVYRLIEGKIGSGFPASFLREHKNLIVIIDKKAGLLVS